ncbi:sugar phosphate phosphatase [Lentilactobacillus fungorum]|uniref:Sugar phosphate phosphatase n=1 Tax=Lentilactobacillus fungorum TaxID=2201250 RepID=A0ABQ3VXM1_9LACO|nr:sugar-phosphatase [Lentilactobacillus fungorum]GHP13133.1 sugar phosphate phosphatase [Lentilactobacillus fungorum]
MDIKLVAIDIDGTLLNEKHQLAEPTITAIKAVREKGIQVVLCTGRPLSGVQPYLDRLEISGASEFAITFNGAMAQTLSGDVLVHHTLSYNDFLETEMLSRKFGVHYQLETIDSIYATNRDLSPYTIGESYLVRLPVKYRSPEDIPSNLVISKVMMIDHPELIKKANQQLPATLRDKLYIVQSEPFFIEIMSKQANKGKTLSELATKLDLTADNVMALGDQENDLTMIKYAGLGVAMGNGIDEVKAAASFITKPNTENGVAYALKKYLL